MPARSPKLSDPCSLSTQLLEDLAPYLPALSEAEKNPFHKYQGDPIAYAEEELGLSPWPGTTEKGQREFFEDLSDSVRKQLAGEPAYRVFRIAAGNGVGKTFGVAMVVNWFFDAFVPSIAVTTAPTSNSAASTLWKDIKKIRPRHLPGRVLPKDPRLESVENPGHHFAHARTTSDSSGTGEERFKGQHDGYLLLIVDEAEGVAKFVYDAIKRMMTGGRVILVILIANPRTRTSEFHRWSRMAGVMNYRWNILDYPNVVHDREIVPGGTMRSWVYERIWEWCEVVSEHDEESFTFTLPFDVPAPADVEGAHGPAGTIFLPNGEFLTAVMGIAPPNLALATYVSPGRFEAATTRGPIGGQEDWARIGVDVARTGGDLGTIYIRHGGKVWRAGTISGSQVEQQTGLVYYTTIKKHALALTAKGVTSLHIRIDGTGGFGSTAIDNLKVDEELQKAFADYQVHEVHFGSSAHEDTKYANIVTEMYAQAGESLKGLRLLSPSADLEADLTERLYGFVNREGRTLQALEDKEKFKKNHGGRSPDDGDGFVLCVAPDFLFQTLINRIERQNPQERRRRYGFA